MPPKVKITKEMILDAAYQIARENGYENINARTIAERLHCSTQPVMYNFRTIDEIRQETYKTADKYHLEYIMPKGRKDISSLIELGINYVRFALEERNLFKFLFQSNQFEGNCLNGMMSDPELTEILKMVSAAKECDTEEAKTIFMSMFIKAHGCASLIANNAIEYNEEQFIKLLIK